MHKQKKISLNILLTACLLLASLWGGVILNAIKNRSTADATRWREFLYASQVDNREASSYTYDNTYGWMYSYGTWEDNLASNISFTKLASSEDSTTYIVSDFDITTGKGSADISSTNTTIKLYTKIGETGLYYNNSLYISSYTLNDTTEDDTESGTEESSTTTTSTPTITIGATSYTANVLGGTTDNPTYYIEYPVKTLYVKYDEANLGTDSEGKVNARSNSNNYGFKLYIDDDYTIEYLESGSISESSISYDTSYTYVFSDPDYGRMEWNSTADTNKYLEKDVTSSDNFAQNSTSNVVILDNYLNNLRAKNNTNFTTSMDYSYYIANSNTYNINNFYVSFGGPAKKDASGYLTDTKIISALTVTAYLNNESVDGLSSDASIDNNYGVRIKIKDVQKDSNPVSFSSNIGGLTNYYWYNYFDLTQIEYILNTNSTAPLLNAYGLYTIVFDYTVSDNVSGNIQNTKEQYVYQFYLTDDTNYVIYPTLNNSAQHLNEYYDANGTDYSTVYYNMKTYNLPTYLFDASKYNVSYSYTSTDNITTTYTTNFKLFKKSGESKKLGLLTINNTSYIIKLDSENNQIKYYIGNESTTLSDENLYGHIEIKEVDGVTGLYLYLNGIAKYNDGMLLRNVANNTPVSYYFPIVLDELGEYTFENKYIIEKDAYNFDIVEPYTYGEGNNAITIGLAKNIFKNYIYYYNNSPYRHSSILNTMEYTNGIYQLSNINNNLSMLTKENDTDYYNSSKDGGFNLVFLGTKSTFMKNKVVTPFQDISTGVYADITGSKWMDANANASASESESESENKNILRDWNYLTNQSSPWTEPITDATTGETKVEPIHKDYPGLASDIPITNLSPVAFNLYGGIVVSDNNYSSSIYYWKKNLTKNDSKGGYYIIGDDLYICGKPTVQNFTNGTSLERSGLYLLKVVVRYQGLTTINEATATQYFMFIIDDSDPEMYFYTGDLDENGVVPEQNKLGMTTQYTNADDLKLYWDEPNYFQEEVTALLEYSSSYSDKNFGTAINYTKGSIISSSAGNLTTSEGVYHFVVYYGKKPFFNSDKRSNQEATIYVDRTTPTVSFYKYTTSSVNGEQINSYSNTDTSLIGNGKFRLYSDKTKASGARITVKYSEINFNTNTNSADLVTIGENQIITTATYLDYVADQNITTTFYDLKSSADSITNVEDNGQNLTLGSNNSATPSKLYIFIVSDEAGNSATYYYIFDNSTPRAIYLQYNEDKNQWEKSDNLDPTSISENTQLYWGNEKGIVLNVKDNVKDETNSTEENPVYTTTYNTLKAAIDYINANSTLYNGFGQKTYNGKNYLTLPISKARVEDSFNNVATTSSASQITIVTKANQDSYNINSDWVVKWKDNSNTKTISDFVSQNKTAYKSVVTDCLGNKSITYSLYLDTDLANLTIFANEIKYNGDSKVDSSQGVNSVSINANNATIYFKKDIAKGIEAYVTYSYYPFAMASYFSSSDVFNKDKNNYTVSSINGDSKNKLYITYPFSQEPLYENQVLNSGDTLLSYRDNNTNMSQEGLYILNRVYRYTDSNEILSPAQVESLSENDIANMNMYIVVDRQGIVSLVTDMSGNVLSNESIGNLIYFKLGDGTDKKYEEEISAGTLNILQQNKVDSSNKKELFNTNRVKVTTFIPYDKYATALKLTDNDLIKFNKDTNNEHIETATLQNNVLFGIYVTLLKVSTNEQGETIYIPIILNNEVTEIGQAIMDKAMTQQCFESISNTEGLSLNHLLSMVQSGTYRLYLADKKLEAGNSSNAVCQLSSNNTTTYYINGQYSNTHYFDYIIEHKLPSGKYTSLSSELELASGQNYKSINKKALSFEFEDYANIYDAIIDPDHFIVSRRVAGSSAEEILLKRENGVYTTKPANMTDEYIAENIFVQSQLQNDLYKYTLNIFDESNTLLSDCDSDYIYEVSIFYVGEESFYSVTNQKANGEYEVLNYFKATYTIHQDTTAPSQNLNNLINIAKEYAGEIDTSTYFFAVDRENTGLTSSDTDESNQIYLRKFDSLDDFSPSLLPGDNNFAGVTSNAHSFNPNSIDTSIYKLAWSYSYDPNNPTNTITFSGQEKGYYELLELDAAQNITRYFVYLNDESNLYVNLNYYQNYSQNNNSLNSVDYSKFDVEDFENPSLNIATLNRIESFMVDDDQLIEYDQKVATSSKDYYTITEDDKTYTYYFDKYIIVYIKDNNGSVVKSLVCDALNETLNIFYARVVEEFGKIQAQKTAFNYTIEILNRFGENYVATLKLPDAELNLTITDKSDYFEVVVPAQSGNVFLTNFKPMRANGGSIEELSNDSANNTIVKSDNLGLQTATYKFGKGDYKFTIIDNYGRENTIYKYFGDDTDDKYVINFGNNYITNTDKDFETITFTNQNVTLNINNSLWGITCYYASDISTLKENINDIKIASLGTDYVISNRVDSHKKYTYTFNQEGYYYVQTNRIFAQGSKNGETFVFCVDRTLPKAYAVFDSGTQRELTNDSYSENITIVWESKYDITGTLRHVSNDGVSTTHSIDKDTIEYYVNVDGSYELTLTDSISNTRTWKFEKIKSSYAYFTIHAEGIAKPLQASKYTEIDDKTTIIQYYYVKYNDTTPEITVMPDSSKGISSQETENSNDYMKEYRIISSNTLSSDQDAYYTICIVRVIFVKESDDFANMEIVEEIDKDGNEVSNNITQNDDYMYTSYARQLKLTFNSINSSTSDDNMLDSSYYNGNTIYLLHYFNDQLVKRYDGNVNQDTISLDITRSGLHRFEIRDLCGNVQKWDGQDHYDLYVVNSVIYTLNDQNPIPNSFYNDEVKLHIVDKLGSDNVLYTYVATAMLNGKELTEFEFDANGEYIFTTPGYYSITITATTSNSSELIETINFTIINQNVAMIAFNIPTSYGFTVESIYKNQANMTNSISNRSTLWLAAGDEIFGSGVFTINASYFDSSLSTTYYFSFKVWINEETPTILPVNYTYGTKTSKAITLQYNGAVIYSQIGLGYIRITTSSGKTVSEYAINEESANEVTNLTINSSGEFIVALYNNEGKLVSSYKVIKTKPLNSSAKIIIIIAVSVTVVLVGVFIFLRKRLRFR